MHRTGLEERRKDGPLDSDSRVFPPPPPLILVFDEITQIPQIRKMFEFLVMIKRKKKNSILQICFKSNRSDHWEMHLTSTIAPVLKYPRAPPVIPAHATGPIRQWQCSGARATLVSGVSGVSGATPTCQNNQCRPVLARPPSRASNYITCTRPPGLV